MFDGAAINNLFRVLWRKKNQYSARKCYNKNFYPKGTKIILWLVFNNTVNCLSMKVYLDIESALKQSNLEHLLMVFISETFTASNDEQSNL